MSFTSPVLVVMHGAAGDGAAERMMAAARVEATQHTAMAALAAGFGGVIVATDSPEVFAMAPDGVILDPDPADAAYDFAPRLRDIVGRYGLERPVVMGSGAGPLLGEAEMRAIAAAIAGPGAHAITNNFFSGDITGWTPGDAVVRLGAFERDNQLPRRLRDDAGIAPALLPRTTATQLDLDTPADLAVLALHDNTPPALGALLQRFDLPLDRYRLVMRVLCNPEGELVVAGRAGSQAWQYLERETACRVRMFSEERGMAAAGAGHQARSLLGYIVEDVGFNVFFERMAALGDALVLDSRVLEAHLGMHPSREDRFQSDLYQPGAIEDPVLREMTEAAMSAPIPVLLGGHSLVAGGLMALNDAAWSEHDRMRGTST